MVWGRMIQTILLMARAMIHDAQIDFNDLWPEAVRTSVYLRNRSPASALNSKMTPYEAWYRQKPSIDHLRPFGCPAYSLVPLELRKKLESRTRHCLLMGYVYDTQKIWRVYDPVQKRVFKSANIVFAEDEMYHPLSRPYLPIKQIPATASALASAPASALASAPASAPVSASVPAPVSVSAPAPVASSVSIPISLPIPVPQNMPLYTSPLIAPCPSTPPVSSNRCAPPSRSTAKPLKFIPYQPKVKALSAYTVLNDENIKERTNAAIALFTHIRESPTIASKQISQCYEILEAGILQVDFIEDSD